MQNCNEHLFDDYLSLFYENVIPSMVRFPIKVTHMRDGKFEPESISEEYSKESASTIIVMIKQAINEAARRVAVKFIVKNSASKYTVKHSGPDSGFLIRFRFEKTNGRWKLIR